MGAASLEVRSVRLGFVQEVSVGVLWIVPVETLVGLRV